MTISMDKHYTTRDGRPVRLLCVDGPGRYPVVGLVGEAIYSWTSTGEHPSEMAKRFGDRCDLIEAKPRVQCEVWVYRASNGNYVPTSAVGCHKFGGAPAARVTIDVEEGHGLEDGE